MDTKSREFWFFVIIWLVPVFVWLTVVIVVLYKYIKTIQKEEEKTAMEVDWKKAILKFTQSGQLGILLLLTVVINGTSTLVSNNTYYPKYLSSQDSIQILNRNLQNSRAKLDSAAEALKQTPLVLKCIVAIPKGYRIMSPSLEFKVLGENDRKVASHVRVGTPIDTEDRHCSMIEITVFLRGENYNKSISQIWFVTSNNNKDDSWVKNEIIPVKSLINDPRVKTDLNQRQLQGIQLLDEKNI